MSLIPTWQYFVMDVVMVDLIFNDLRAVSDRKRIFGAQNCAHVLEEDKPILRVSRELDGEVLALCGGENDSAQTTRTLTLDKLLELDPTPSLLADMPDGRIRSKAEQRDDSTVSASRTRSRRAPSSRCRRARPGLR
jgi:hypothetical protein